MIVGVGVVVGASVDFNVVVGVTMGVVVVV